MERMDEDFMTARKKSHREMDSTSFLMASGFLTSKTMVGATAWWCAPWLRVSLSQSFHQPNSTRWAMEPGCPVAAGSIPIDAEGLSSALTPHATFGFSAAILTLGSSSRRRED